MEDSGMFVMTVVLYAITMDKKRAMEEMNNDATDYRL
jgi:hypothetical protein